MAIENVEAQPRKVFDELQLADTSIKRNHLEDFPRYVKEEGLGDFAIENVPNSISDKPTIFAVFHFGTPSFFQKETLWHPERVTKKVLKIIKRGFSTQAFFETRDTLDVSTIYTTALYNCLIQSNPRWGQDIEEDAKRFKWVVQNNPVENWHGFQFKVPEISVQIKSIDYYGFIGVAKGTPKDSPKNTEKGEREPNNVLAVVRFLRNGGLLALAPEATPGKKLGNYDSNYQRLIGALNNWTKIDYQIIPGALWKDRQSRYHVAIGNPFEPQKDPKETAKLTMVSIGLLLPRKYWGQWKKAIEECVKSGARVAPQLASDPRPQSQEHSTSKA